MQLVDLNLGAVGLLLKSPWWFWAYMAKFGGWYCQQSEAFTLRLTSASPLVAQPASPGTGLLAAPGWGDDRASWGPWVPLSCFLILWGLPLCSLDLDRAVCVRVLGWLVKSVLGRRVKPHLAWLFSSRLSLGTSSRILARCRRILFSASGVNAHHPVRRGWCRGPRGRSASGLESKRERQRQSNRQTDTHTH